MIDTEWMNEGACADPRVDSALFFPSPSDKSSRAAKRICAGCPKIDRCLQHAVEYHEVGVWGGTNDYDRRVMRRNSARDRRAA